MKRAVLAAAAFALTCALTYGVANAQRGDRRPAALSVLSAKARTTTARRR